MNPQKGQFVQVRFNNGVFFDATVEKWSDQKSVLILQNNDKVIIQRTLRDVLLVKIFNIQNKEAENLKEEDSHKILHDEMNSLSSNAVTPDSLKRMSELKDELNKIERQEVFNRLKSNKINEAREINYVVPRNIPVSRTPQYTNKEITSTNSIFSSELQTLFSKKY